MGIRPGDIVLVGAILSLYMGSWGALAGAERLHCKAFPFGAGAPGMTARAAQWLDQMKPSAFYGTPSFALHLAEKEIALAILLDGTLEEVSAGPRASSSHPLEVAAPHAAGAVVEISCPSTRSVGSFNVLMWMTVSKASKIRVV